MKVNRVLPLLFFVMLLSGHALHAQQQQEIEEIPLAIPVDDLAAGECRCRPPNDFLDSEHEDADAQPAQYLNGGCRYRPFQYGGAESFQRLLQTAQLYVRRHPLDGTSAHVNNLRPIAPGDGTIQWWLEGDDPNQVHPANYALCNVLKSRDTLPPSPTRTMVSVEAFIYSFESGYEHQLGLDIATFFGNKSNSPASPINTEARTDLDLQIGEGILSGGSSIGNPLASFLNLGIRYAESKNHAKKHVRHRWACYVGETCTGKDQMEHLFRGVTSMIRSEIGVSFSATPKVWANGDIELAGLSFFYAIPTFSNNENTPVRRFQPYSGGRSLWLKSDELFVMSSHMSELDMNTDTVLGDGRNRIHTETLLMIRAAYQVEEASDHINSYGIPLLPQQKMASEDRQSLPNGEISLEDILTSAELVCYPNPVDPRYTEPACGFRFKKADQHYLDTRLKVSIKGPVQPGQKAESHPILETLVTGNGYYQLPILEHPDSDDQDYTLRIELRTPKDRSEHSVVGVKYPFTHYNSSPENPITFDPEDRSLIKKGLWEKIFGS